MSAILIEHQIVHYEVLGRGRPILFIHGWVGSWRYWIPSMQAVSVQYRAYAIDLWGFGESAKNTQRYALDEQVNLIDIFMQQMGIGRIALVGHGLGAVVAILFAQKNPTLVDRVMAVGLPLDDASVSPRLKTTPPAELADWLLSRSPTADAQRPDALKADPQALFVSVSGMQTAGLANLPARMTNACLLVHGENDPAILPPKLENLAVLPPQAHDIFFEESGHFPMLDEANKFNRLLNDFLALTSGESPRDLQLKEEWKRRVR